MVYLSLSSIARSSILDVDIGSSAEVGSSIRITSGSTASVLAMHNLCCCPPDKPSADFFNLSFTSSHIAACFKALSTIISRSAFLCTPNSLGPYAILSYTLLGKGLGCWNTIPTLCLNVISSISVNIFFPSRRTSPSIVTLSTRSFILLSVFKNVDLPHPEGPINAVI